VRSAGRSALGPCRSSHARIPWALAVTTNKGLVVEPSCRQARPLEHGRSRFEIPPSRPGTLLARVSAPVVLRRQPARSGSTPGVLRRMVARRSVTPHGCWTNLAWIGALLHLVDGWHAEGRAVIGLPAHHCATEQIGRSFARTLGLVRRRVRTSSLSRWDDTQGNPSACSVPAAWGHLGRRQYGDDQSKRCGDDGGRSTELSLRTTLVVAACVLGEPSGGSSSASDSSGPLSGRGTAGTSKPRVDMAHQ
jgi:hypothetical protein